MKFGLFVMGTRDGSYADVADQVVEAEERGFDSVWLAERHFQHGDLLWPAPTVAAAYLAARTWRIRLGLGARILPFYNPVQVAEEMATLDRLSGGRLDLGLTRAGLDETFHQVFRAPLAETRERFEEGLGILLRALAGERFAHAGKHYQFPEIQVTPRPVQRPHPPLYFVANSPDSIDHAAAKGVPIFIHGAQKLQDAAGRRSRYDAVFAKAGHVREPPCLLNRFIYVGQTTARARREIERPFLTFLHERAPDLRDGLRKAYGAAALDFDFLAEHICIFGDVAHCVARVQEAFAATRVETLLATVNLITMPQAQCLASMRLFADEVLPAVRAGARAGRPRHEGLTSAVPVLT